MTKFGLSKPRNHHHNTKMIPITFLKEFNPN